MATFTGTSGNDTITPTLITPGVIVSPSGSNLLGNDIITGGSGNDVIDASTGNDTITGGDGNDSIIGGDGNDVVILNAGEGAFDTVNGGAGFDEVRGNGANVLVFNNFGVLGQYENFELLTNGNRNVAGNANNNTLNFTGVALFTGATPVPAVDGAAGNDTITASDQTDGIAYLGGAGDDTLIGQARNDTLQGGDGADNISGGGGNDTISGGTQQVAGIFDTIDAGAGDDLITLNQRDGEFDLVDGGTGTDTVAGNGTAGYAGDGGPGGAGGGQRTRAGDERRPWQRQRTCPQLPDRPETHPLPAGGLPVEKRRRPAGQHGYVGVQGLHLRDAVPQAPVGCL